MKKIVLFLALSIMTVAFGYAQSQAEIKMKEIVKKYEKTNGVECMVLSKGIRLGLVKMALNEQIGKDIMKGVTCITIINYSDADQNTCAEINKDIDYFKSILQNFNSDDKKESDQNENTKAFAAVADDGTISDLIFLSEDKETKMVMHMAGHIKVTDIQQ